MSTVEMLGSLGSFISSVAVTASVIYLALQVKHANRLARLGAIDALRDGTNRFREIVLQDSNLEVWLKGIRHANELTDVERYRWDELALYFMDAQQATYLRAAQLGERFTVRRIGYTVRYSSTGDSFTSWWAMRRERYHPDFVRFVDDNVGKPIEPLGTHRRRRATKTP